MEKFEDFAYFWPTFTIDGSMSCGMVGEPGYTSQYYSSKTSLFSSNRIQFTCASFNNAEYYTIVILKLWVEKTSIYW